ncbi:hypothetical protein HDV05_005758 [Chytridiales sp. JEL 0842]|nr:hypothetical protein HDV05_005758 [Chytridiales sp. JEL 0842]
MFSSILKKVGELGELTERTSTPPLGQTPTSESPSANGQSPGTAVDPQRMHSLSLALERTKAAQAQLQTENEALKKANSTLEQQMKELRLKAKLKITQMQRELNQKNAALGGSPNGTGAANTPTLNPPSPRSSIDALGTPRMSTPAPEQNAAEVAELKARIEALTEELAAARQQTETPPNQVSSDAKPQSDKDNEALEREVEDLRQTLIMERREKSAAEARANALAEQVNTMTSAAASRPAPSTSVDTSSQEVPEKTLSDSPKSNSAAVARISELEQQVQRLQVLTERIPELESKALKLAELESKDNSQDTTALESKVIELEQIIESLKETAPTPIQPTPTDAESKLQQEADKLRNELLELKKSVLEKETEVGALKASIQDAQSKSSMPPENQAQFALQEQITDLKVQLANRQRELASITEAHQRLQTESEKMIREGDEKIKKLKGLLGQASRSLQESKRVQIEKDGEIERLRTKADDGVKHVDELKAALAEQKASAERLLTELQDEREISGIKIAELDKHVKDAQAETANVKSEFQSYKVRALAALQKSSSEASESRIAELEELNSKISREKLKLEKEVASYQERIQTVESELSTTLEQLVALETQTKKMEGNAREVALLRQELETANRRVELEKEMSAEALHAKELQLNNMLDALKKEAKRAAESLEEQLKQKTSEAGSLSSIAERLGQELSSLRSELAQAQADADRAKAAAAAASAAVASSGAILPSLSGISTGGGGFFSGNTGSFSQSVESLNGVANPMTASPRTSISSRNVPHQESFADLLSNTPSSYELGSQVSNALGGSNGRGLLANSMKEKELSMKFEQVSELLAEAEEQIRKLTHQEKLLKEEIRKYERIDKMQNLNMEYLKNIVFSFLETAAKEPLVPVIAKLLELSPDEVKRLRNTIVTPQASATSLTGSMGSLTTFNFFSS